MVVKRVPAVSSLNRATWAAWTSTELRCRKCFGQSLLLLGGGGGGSDRASNREVLGLIPTDGTVLSLSKIHELSRVLVNTQEAVAQARHD